jgi:hypothetical protein
VGGAANDSVLEYADPGLTLLTRGNVSVCLLREALTSAKLQELRNVSARVHQRLGAGRINLSVIEPRAMLQVPDEVRTQSAELIREFPGALEVTILEGGGFRAAAVRAILNGMALLSAGRGRRVFDTVAAAAEWLGANGHLRGLTGPELVALIEQARATTRR